ncbi:hypothetical protein LFZ5_12810 [Salmonella enterica subsp. enterica serovar Apapa str. SA20060561]|nr:hypothetical protein LFZ5_12810 [Salmonella enterica subsp. enterica serovar Apapa str. SA20060561]
MCWLRITRPIHGPRPDGTSLTPVTSLSMLLGTHSLAAFKQLELFWVYTMSGNRSADNVGASVPREG